MTAVSLGDRLSGLREFLGLTPEDLASLSGVPIERLLGIEQGVAGAPVDDLELHRLASELGVRSSYFTDPSEALGATATIVGRILGELSGRDEEEALRFAAYLRYSVDP